MDCCIKTGHSCYPGDYCWPVVHMVRLHLPAKYYCKSTREQPTEIHRRHILTLESYLLQAEFHRKPVPVRNTQTNLEWNYLGKKQQSLELCYNKECQCLLQQGSPWPLWWMKWYWGRLLSNTVFQTSCVNYSTNAPHSSTLIHNHHHHQGDNTTGPTSGWSDKGFAPICYMNEHLSQQKNIEILKGLLM